MWNASILNQVIAYETRFIFIQSLTKSQKVKSEFKKKKKKQTGGWWKWTISIGVKVVI